MTERPKLPPADQAVEVFDIGPNKYLYGRFDFNQTNVSVTDMTPVAAAAIAKVEEERTKAVVAQAAAAVREAEERTRQEQEATRRAEEATKQAKEASRQAQESSKQAAEVTAQKAEDTRRETKLSEEETKRSRHRMITDAIAFIPATLGAAIIGAFHITDAATITAIATLAGAGSLASYRLISKEREKKALPPSTDG